MLEIDIVLLASFLSLIISVVFFCKVASSLWDLDLVFCFLEWIIVFLCKIEIYLLSISYVQCTELGVLGVGGRPEYKLLGP